METHTAYHPLVTDRTTKGKSMNVNDCPRCGRSYTLDDFLNLPIPPKGGVWRMEEVFVLILRNCHCGSTRSIEETDTKEIVRDWVGSIISVKEHTFTARVIDRLSNEVDLEREISKYSVLPEYRGRIKKGRQMKIKVTRQLNNMGYRVQTAEIRIQRNRDWSCSCKACRTIISNDIAADHPMNQIVS